MEGKWTSSASQISRILSFELIPVGSFNGWGVTLFDALDTMWLMDLHNLFWTALQFAAKADFTLTEVRGNQLFCDKSCRHDSSCRISTLLSSRQLFVIWAACSPHMLCQENQFFLLVRMILEGCSFLHSTPHLGFLDTLSIPWREDTCKHALLSCRLNGLPVAKRRWDGHLMYYGLKH